MRKIERRLPAGYQTTDLGEASSAADGRCALVSFATAPLVAGRENTYVLFVTDDALAASVQSIEWTFTENGSITNTEYGALTEVVYAPQGLGTLNLTVGLLDAADNELSTVSLEQMLVGPSQDLEDLIAAATEQPGPGASNPDVLRELVNQHCIYYFNAQPTTPEPGDAFARFLFGTVASAAGRRTPVERSEHVAEFAEALESSPEDYARLAAEGLGVANLRLAILAMVMPQTAGGGTPFLPWTELPEDPAPYAVADEALRAQLNALPEEQRIDLVNIARFPKSNLTACSRILETLRDHYFAGADFEDVLSGMNGTRAHWILTHLTEGPIAHV